MSNELYYSKSKDKYIKIAEMPDVHVRRAFIKMNEEVGFRSGFLEDLIRIRSGIQSLITEIQEDKNEDK
jgi:hypothetical protein